MVRQRKENLRIHLIHKPGKYYTYSFKKSKRPNKQNNGNSSQNGQNPEALTRTKKCRCGKAEKRRCENTP
jgi:hypothetical protein